MNVYMYAYHLKKKKNGYIRHLIYMIKTKKFLIGFLDKAKYCIAD